MKEKRSKPNHHHQHYRSPKGAHIDPNKDGTDDERDVVSPLLDQKSPYATLIRSAASTRQDNLRLMNVLNGEMEKNWIISDVGKSPARNQSISNIQNTVARRLSASPVTSPMTLRKRISTSNDPRPVALHRVLDMVEGETDPLKQELQGERTVTAFLKHEKVASSDKLNVMDIETEPRSKMTIETIISPRAFQIISPANHETMSDVGSSSSENTFTVPKLKRKLSDHSPETRYDPYKRALARPGTPSPSTSSPGSPWRTILTPERFKRLKRNLSSSESSRNDEPMTERTRASSVISISRTPRFSAISSEAVEEEMDEDFRLDDKDTASLASTREHQERYEWRQTDEEEWDRGYETE